MNLNKLITLARAGYDLLIKVASRLQSPFLLVIRLYWGWEFFISGKGKLADLSGPTEFFTKLGIPFPAFNAGLAGATECFGGLLLLLGLASRLAAIPLIVTMLVAYITDGREALLSFFSEPDTFFKYDAFLFLFASVLVFIFGPGKFSIDHLIKRKLNALAGRVAQEQEPAKPLAHDSKRAIAL